MDTEDPAISDGGIKLKVGGRDHDGKKKAKKKKEKMISLDEYQAKHGDFGAQNAAPPSNNWAVMTETAEDDYESSFKFDRSQLPSAPKAAMGPSVDLSLIPSGGPFSAYIGNLSYDANEEDLHRLFSKLEIDTVRIIQDGGRPRGYAYVDFLTKESLVEALSYNEREYMNRNIRVDLATDKNQEGRPGGPGGRPNEPDRTEGDWRRGPSDSAPSNSFSSRGDSDSRSSRFGGDRERDRGYGFGGDRDRDRRGGGSSFGDRDRGFGGDRDRGFGGDRDRGFGGDRDRGFGGDRDRGFGGDRDRGFGGGRDRDRGFGGDRDRGFGGDRDRGFGGDRDRGFGGDRDRGGQYGARDFDDSKFDRKNMDATPRSRDGSRDGGFDRDKRSFGGDRDSDRGGRYGGSRGGGYERDDRRRDDYRRQDNGFDRRPRSRDGSLDKSDGPKERPVLKLQPRSKPVEQESSGKASSIFGAAKPVDTYAKEKEMEEKLKKKDDRPDREEPRRREDDSSRPRRSAEDGADRRRKSSSGSGGSEWPRSALPVQKPHVGRRASEDSVSSANENPKSPTSPKPADNPDSKLVPAPPPKENAWAKKREGPPTSPTDSRDSSNNASSAGARKDDRRDDRKPPAGRGRQGGDNPRDRDNKDRRPGGPRANGDGSGGDHQQVKKHQREKKVPKSIEEMPKFEEDRSRDFSTVNKYAFLMADNDDGGDNDSNDEANQGKDAAADVASS